MDLTTTYMGLDLKNPLVVSASPLTKEFDNFKKLEDAGVSAIVCHSLFEEQLRKEAQALDATLEQGVDSFAEAVTYFPPENFKLGPDEYCHMIAKAKDSLTIPVIASLNGYTNSGWLDYARKIEESGADAIELNIFSLPTQTTTTSDDVEETYSLIARAVKSCVNVPVAVKLHPYFSALANIADHLDKVGVDGLVLFNRFYQPDINLDDLEVESKVMYSTQYDLLLPLRWIAILYGKVTASLAATSGIYQVQDVVKAVMTGADVTMMCSALLESGPAHASKVLKDLESWMAQKGYDSIDAMKGILSQQKCAHPESFERANYIEVLNSY